CARTVKPTRDRFYRHRARTSKERLQEAKGVEPIRLSCSIPILMVCAAHCAEALIQFEARPLPRVPNDNLESCRRCSPEKVGFQQHGQTSSSEARQDCSRIHVDCSLAYKGLDIN